MAWQRCSRPGVIWSRYWSGIRRCSIAIGIFWWTWWSVLKLAAQGLETPMDEGGLPGNRLGMGGGALPSPCAEAGGDLNSLRVGCGTTLCVFVAVDPSNSFNWWSKYMSKSHSTILVWGFLSWSLYKSTNMTRMFSSSLSIHDRWRSDW